MDSKSVKFGLCVLPFNRSAHFTSILYSLNHYIYAENNIRFVNTTISWRNFISHIRLALLCDATEEIQFVNLAVKTQAQQLMFSRNLNDILLSFPILLFLLWWYSAFHVKLSASITHVAILNPQPCHLFVQIFMVTLTL